MYSKLTQGMRRTPSVTAGGGGGGRRGDDEEEESGGFGIDPLGNFLKIGLL